MLPSGQPEPFAESTWMVMLGVLGGLGAALAEAGAKARHDSSAAHTAAIFTMTISFPVPVEPDKVSMSN
jgi:hypothetical protein